MSRRDAGPARAGGGVIAGLLAAVAGAAAQQRAALTAEFGWTLLELHAQVEPEARVLRLRGEVALPRGICAAQRAVAPLLPAGWRLDAAGLRVRAPLGRRAPGPGVTCVWRTPALALAGGSMGHVLKGMSPGTGPMGHVPRGMSPGPGVGLRAGLSTELLPGDGPLELLAELPGCALVRADDGTVGWVGGRLAAMHGPRGPRVGARVCGRVPAGAALRRLTTRLRSYLGVRYRLGGTTRRHIDCSGLVQRAVREALGLVLPRHSTDQQALGVAPARALGEPGDLLFMTGVDGAACHVGVVLRGRLPGERTVVHASASRGRVIEEPLDRCLARVGRVAHLELAQLLEL